MDNVVVFDSDFIIANIKNIKEYIEKYEMYNCYTTEINLNEVASYNYIKKMTMIAEFKKEIKNLNTLGIKFKKDEEEIKLLIKEESVKYLTSIFNSNIIRHHSRTNSLLLERAYDKIPPFGKSDEGFKDTLILLDIIDYIKGKEVKKLFFVTNDDDFLKQKNIIEKEVLEKTSCKFLIIEGRNPEKLLNYFKIGNDKEINKLSDNISNNENINIDIKSLRNDLTNICYDLFHFDYYDQYTGNECVGNNFSTNDIISKKQIEGFLNNLSSNINNNVFNSSLIISDFFEDPFIFSNEQKIDIEVFEKLNNIYTSIKNNKKYKEALLNLLYSNFIDLVESKRDNVPRDNVLPF